MIKTLARERKAFQAETACAKVQRQEGSSKLHLQNGGAVGVGTGKGGAERPRLERPRLEKRAGGGW